MSRDRLADAVLLATLAAVPLAWTPWLADPWRTARVTLLGCGALASLALHAAGERPWRLPRWLAAGGGLFLAAVAFAALRPAAPSTSTGLGAMLAGWILLCAVLAARLEPGTALEIRAARTLLAVAALEAVIGVGQLLASLARGRGGGKLAVAGTFGNSEQLASFLGVVLALGALGAGRLSRAWRAALLLPIGLCFALARSRGAWLAATIVFGTIAVARLGRRPRRWLATAAAGATLALVLAWPHLPAELTSLHTLRGRWLVWNVAFRQVAETRGLGLGLGGFRQHFLDGQAALFETGRWDAFAENAALVSRVHHEYLDFLVEAGLAGLGGWLLVVGGAARTAWRHRADLAPYGAALAFALVHSLVSFPFHVPGTLAALALVVGRLAAAAADGRGAIVLPGRRAIALLAAAGAVAFGVGESRRWRAEAAHARALSAVAAGRLGEAGREVDAALALRPRDERIALTRARISYQTGHLDEALALLRQLVARDRTIDPLKLQGRVLLESGRPGEAILVFRRLAAAYPDHVTPRYDLGRAYLALGRLDEAAAAFRAALERRAVSPKGRWEQGLAAQYLEAMGRRLND